MREKGRQGQEILDAAFIMKNKEEKNKMLLEAASEVFLELGLHKTTLDGIARRAGTGQGYRRQRYILYEHLVILLRFDKDFTNC